MDIIDITIILFLIIGCNGIIIILLCDAIERYVTEPSVSTGLIGRLVLESRLLPPAAALLMAAVLLLLGRRRCRCQ